MLYRLFHLDLTQKDDRNAWFLCVEILWASILGSATTFNAAFAIRLGATDTQIGLLTSIPGLLAVLVSIPAGRILQTRRNTKPWILGSLTLYRIGFLAVALLPWIKIGIPYGALIVAVLVIITIPANFFNVGFIPMLSEVIPVERRASVFSARSIINGATLTACGFIFGYWLSRISFPLNYQTLYIMGFIASMVSVYYLIKVQVPETLYPAVEKPRPASLRHRWQSTIEEYTSHPQFFRLITNTFMHSVGMWTAAPLYVLYYVNVRGASDGWIGLQGAIASLVTIIGFAFWRWLMARLGEPMTLKRTIICLGLFPILVGLSPSLTPIFCAITLNGLISPGVSLSHLSTLMKVTPEDNRPGYTAIYMTLMNIGIFIFPMIGVTLGGRFGIGPTLIGCGLLSILGASSFWWRPVQTPEPKPYVSPNPAVKPSQSKPVQSPD